jgi:predicted RNase H-like nuclease
VLFLGVDLAWGEGLIRRANESGVAALDETGVILDAGWTRGVDETQDWIARTIGRRQNVLLLVDAPLLVLNADGQRLCEKQVGERYGRWKVSANSSNLATPHRAGVVLRQRLELLSWRYDDGWDGPPRSGRALSECYPYTTLVGAPELGYLEERPRYKRVPRTMRVTEFRPVRAAACDLLVHRLAALAEADPPLRLDSHPVTRKLLDEPSPLRDREYKHREDLIDGVLCAWTAALWCRHGFAGCQVLGPPPGDADQGRQPTIIAPAREAQRRSVAGSTAAE